jgi:hypothetical protein
MNIQNESNAKPHLWVNHNFYTGDLDFSTEKEWELWEMEKIYP